MTSPNKQGGAKIQLFIVRVPCCSILTLVPVLRPPELQKHHFTLTGKQKQTFPAQKQAL